VTSPHTIAIVIPCYNEEQRLNVDIFTTESLKNSNLTLLFVNDGSWDNTLKVIQDICMSNPERASCLSLDKNNGKGEAVRRGMLYLLETGRYDLIGYWDADLAVPLSEVSDFTAVFKTSPNVRAVIGSRVHLAGRLIERVNVRHYIGRLFATLMCWTFAFTIYDTQCGAKLFDKKVLSTVVQEPFCSKWIFDVEIIVRISRLSFLQNQENWLYEIPVKEWRNVSGTKRSVSAYITGLFDYLTLVKKYLL
jgi:glycosyltransferase involved in cell wall biosynthesis